jgi:eukaryotic-like serine/threonine-protein kinase
LADEIIGNYRLLKCMMTGQSSQVWEVAETSSHRHFAMKLLLPEKVNDRECRRILFHEATVGLKLAHPNVIKITFVNKNPTNPYFVMEYFPAGSLKLRLLNKDKAQGINFIKERAHSIFKQAATALAYMNANGWVHRDVKPDNLLVNAAGDLRLIDFGLAQRVQKKSFFNFLRRRGPSQGTRSYMSPEQIRNDWLDARSDVYSFGITVFELLTGRPPFRGATNQELLVKHFTEKPVSPQVYTPDVTDEFSALVLKMLSKHRDDRPRDFHEVLMAMRTLRIFKGEARRVEQM